ncbi:hypothetical protein STTU_p0110 (plasmid) [Streptomyces sp. Tu6071]|nr:hypothetical protein STTU_p0110 [Streptomyces sp. Tu6071]
MQLPLGLAATSKARTRHEAEYPEFTPVRQVEPRFRREDHTADGRYPCPSYRRTRVTARSGAAPALAVMPTRLIPERRVVGVSGQTPPAAGGRMT